MKLSREDAIEYVLDRYGKKTVYVFATGYISRTAYKLCRNKYTAFYMQGSMGLALSIALGVALCQNRPVVCVDGDGASVMMAGTMATNHYYGDRVTHIVLANNCYESTGGQYTINMPMANKIEVECSEPDPRIPIKCKEITDGFINSLTS